MLNPWRSAEPGFGYVVGRPRRKEIEREYLLADKKPGTKALLRGLPKLCPARFLSGNNPGACFGREDTLLR